MMRGRKPLPTAVRRINGNPGKRGYNAAEPLPPGDIPECPAHLNAAGREEWQRIAVMLHQMGVLTTVDRAVLAAYCQSWGRWVEAEEKLMVTPMMLKAPSGYVQQSPWLSIANKQLELMGRFMAELGLTPASRARVITVGTGEKIDRIERIIFTIGGDAPGPGHIHADRDTDTDAAIAGIV